MSARSSAEAIALAVLLAGCGGNAPPTMKMLTPCTPDDAACACSPAVDRPAFEGATHVPEPTMVTYQANPPASGPHWPMWQEPWDYYPAGLPRERWVHNLEHGGVVLLYNCPDGCDADVQSLIALRLGRHPDQYNEIRILIVPDSEMPHRFAAVAWLYRWQADAVDTDAINCFIDARYDRAPESIP
jgi:hypothetical protein